MRQRRIGMWSRAVGDLMDLGLLAAAYRHKRADAGRLRAAMGIVGAFFATDLATAVALTRAEGGDVTAGSTSAGEGAPPEPEGGPLHVRTAVTIRAGEEEVRRAFREHRWSAFDPVALEASGDVRFVSAPGDRGTEVHLDHEPEARAGAAGAAAAKLLGRAPDQEIHDELRRFKALVETGVVMGSDKSPEGAAARRQIMHKRRPAQPAGKES